NSVRLVEVALDAGADAAYRVDNAGEIDEAWLDGVQTVGLTSGASVPEDLVTEVVDWLAQRGFPTVEEHRTTEESLMFSLPRELRRDLKSSASTGSALGAVELRRVGPGVRVGSGVEAVARVGADVVDRAGFVDRDRQLGRLRPAGRSFDLRRSFEVAVDDSELAHPARCHQDAALQRTDGVVVGLDGVVELAAQPADVAAQGRQPRMQVSAQRQHLLGVAGQGFLPPRVADRT